MIICSDLSDVLIKGIYGFEKIVAARYGEDVAKKCWVRFLEVENYFRDLLRGEMAEDEFWRIVLSEGTWPFGLSEIKGIFSKNLQGVVPGTLDVYRRIVSHPCSLVNHHGMALSGRPEIYIISDHIEERLDEVKGYHPDVFSLVSKTFWSCELGMIKMDDNFFPRFLRIIDVPKDEIIFIDDNSLNTTAAAQAGIASIRFENATQLETVMKEYGFQFAEATR